MFRWCVGLFSSHSNMHESQILMTGTARHHWLCDLLIVCSCSSYSGKLHVNSAAWNVHELFLGGSRDDVRMIAQVTWDDADAPHMPPPFFFSTKPVWGLDITNDLMVLTLMRSPTARLTCGKVPKFIGNVHRHHVLIGHGKQWKTYENTWKHTMKWDVFWDVFEIILIYKLGLVSHWTI